MPTPPHERRVFTYTTAPSDYDWFGSATVRVVGHDKRGKPIRLVSSDPKYAQSQRERYMSGNHMAVDDAEWEKLVKYNLVTLTKALTANPKLPKTVKWQPSGKTVQVDPEPRTIKKFETSRPYVFQHKGQLYVVVDHTEYFDGSRPAMHAGLRAHPAVVEGQALQANPSGGAVAALVGLGVLVVGWLVLSPKKASAAPAATSQPPLPPTQVQPALPPAPEPKPAPTELTAAKPEPTAPVPDQPLTQATGCDSAKIIQYKFTGTEPLLYTYRRLTVWDKPATPSGLKETFEDQGWLPADQRSVGIYYGEFGDELKNKALLYYSTVYFLAEMWVWTSEGWCLDATTRNYTPVVPTQSPSQVVSPTPEQTQSPSQVISP